MGASECINWDGFINQDGYGMVGRHQRAHRVEWERKHGKIPDGLQIDHLCRNRRCINLEHMELVTRLENVMRGESEPAKNARKVVCVRGHPLFGENLSISPKGRRICKSCLREKAREWRATHRHANDTYPASERIQ